MVAADGPPGRTVHGLAYDESRGALVLFGGAERMSVLDDLWQLADGAWKRLGP